MPDFLSRDLGDILVHVNVSAPNDPLELTYNPSFRYQVPPSEIFIYTSENTDSGGHFDLGECHKECKPEHQDGCCVAHKDDKGARSLLFEVSEALQREMTHAILRVAFLSACDSREVARDLLLRHTILNDIARQFEAQFYRFLTGLPVDEAMWRTRRSFQDSKKLPQSDYLAGAMMAANAFLRELGELKIEPNFFGRKRKLCDVLRRLTTRSNSFNAGISGQGKTMLAMGAIKRADDEPEISARDYLRGLAKVLFPNDVPNDVNEVEMLGKVISNRSRLLRILLNQGITVKILATSQENLRWPGEEVVPLKGLTNLDILLKRWLVVVTVRDTEKIHWLKGGVIKLNNPSDINSRQQGEMNITYFAQNTYVYGENHAFVERSDILAHMKIALSSPCILGGTEYDYVFWVEIVTYWLARASCDVRVREPRRVFREQDLPCSNCKTNGKICIIQVTPSKSEVCLKCLDGGKGTTCCIAIGQILYTDDSASAVLADSQPMGTFVSFQNDYIEPGIICKDRMYPDITDSRPTATLSTSCNDIESGGNLTHQRGSGAILVCNCCSKHSVTIEKFGNIMLCPQCIGFISSTVPCTRPVSISTQKIETPRQRPPTSYYAYAAKRSGIENTTTNSWRHLHPSPQPHGSDDRIVSDSDGMQNISLHQSNPCPSELFSFGQEVQSIEATLSPSKLRYVPIRNISSRCTPSRKLRCDRCSTRRISSSNDCTISTSRWRDPGTCGECVRRKIPCIGEGSYGCKFHQTAYHCRTIHQESTLISDDNGPSKGPKQKRGRQGGFDDNDDRKKRKATGEIDNVDPSVDSTGRWRMSLEKLVPENSIYSMEDCVIGNSIGSGASMHVFEGICNIAGKKVKIALKRPRITAHQKKDFIRLTSVFRRELTIMERLKQSSNVVNFYGLIFDRLTPMLIVELATCSLDSYLSIARQRGQPISWTEKLRLCCNICDGLLALHSAEIVHSDIKASNVLVFIDRNDGSPTAKISDFGFSFKIASTSFYEGGTLAFAAPECTRLGLVTHPKLLEWRRDKFQDVYSYGILLWQVAMDGKKPYSKLSRSDIEAAKTDDPQLSILMSQLPLDTPLVFRKCIKATTKYMPPDRISLNDLETLLLDELATLQRPIIKYGNSGRLLQETKSAPQNSQIFLQLKDQDLDAIPSETVTSSTNTSQRNSEPLKNLSNLFRAYARNRSSSVFRRLRDRFQRPRLGNDDSDDPPSRRIKFLLDSSTAVYCDIVKEAGYKTKVVDSPNTSRFHILHLAQTGMSLLTTERSYIDTKKGNQHGILILPDRFNQQNEENNWLLRELLNLDEDINRIRLYPIGVYEARLEGGNWRIDGVCRTRWADFLGKKERKEHGSKHGNIGWP